jgi:hypothetical protein
MHPAVLLLSGTHRSGFLTTVRPLVTSCASREPMGGGADILLESKSHSTPGVAPRDGEKTLVAQWIREARRGWWEARETVARGAGDGNNRQTSAGGHAGGVAGPASPGEHAPSSGEGPGAPRRQKASHGDQRQRADAMSRASPPNTVFCSRTIAPAPPHGRGGTDSHFSGSCHRWDGRCSQRWRRRDAVGTNARGAGDENRPQASASQCTREIL